jgi:GTP-binding protein
VNERPDDVDPDGAFDAEALEAGRKLFAGSCEFIAGAANIESLPSPIQTEVAFAGRSNVGKSSLINALTGRRTLARTSSTPGRTQQVNFFDLGHQLVLVDLPGYGYARAGKGAVQSWGRLIDLYLKGRANLRRVLVLVDTRRGIGPADRDVMTGLDNSAVSYQVVLTKADKAGKGDDAATAVAARITEEIKTQSAAHPEVLLTSAHTGAGIEELRAALAMLALPEQLG